MNPLVVISETLVELAKYALIAYLGRAAFDYLKCRLEVLGKAAALEADLEQSRVPASGPAQNALDGLASGDAKKEPHWRPHLQRHAVLDIVRARRQHFEDLAARVSGRSSHVVDPEYNPDETPREGPPPRLVNIIDAY